MFLVRFVFCFAQADSVPDYFGNPDYQQAVTAALTLQMQADSLQREVELNSARVATAAEGSKPAFWAVIRDDAEMERYARKQAEQWFAKAAAFVTAHQQNVAAIAATEQARADSMQMQYSPQLPQMQPVNFDILAYCPYSDTNPIPLDSPLPDGVVYCIQLGAYSRPKPPTAFKGLTPVMAEQLPNGVLKYYVGQFRTNAAAETALQLVKHYGFTDAFVAAFYNRRNILTSRAVELEKRVNKF